MPTIETAAFYHSHMRAAAPFLRSATNSQLDAIGRGVCAVLRPNDTSSWVVAVKSLTEYRIPARQAGAVIVYSAYRFCPGSASALPSSSGLTP